MKVLLVIILLFISGCSMLSPFIDKAAKVNDDAINAAEFTVCNGASVGSIKRRFNTPELAELWRELCKENQGFGL